MNAKVKKYIKNLAVTILFPVVIYLLFMILAFATNNQDKYFSAYITSKIFKDSVLTTIVALAVAIPLSGGRWDFATGTIAVLGGIIAINIGMMLKLNVFLILLLCILVCIILALIEGVIYLVLRVPTMIMSLGVVMIYEALSVVLFEGKGANIFNASNEYTTNLLLISKAPWCFILLFVVMGIVYFLLYKTKFGQDSKSLGANAKLAINQGVKEKKNILICYIVVGFLMGCAALLNASNGKIDPASNLSSTTLMFSSMAPVLIGLFLANYSNLPWGTFVGAIAMNTLTYGLSSIGADTSLQTIVTGIVIVLFTAYTTNQQIIKNVLKQTIHFGKSRSGV